MAEPESIQTMLQASFVKVGDGNYSLKTTGGGGGATNVTIDPTGNTVKLDQTGTNNTVKIAANQQLITIPAANQSLPAFGKVTSPGAAAVIATLALTPAGTYDVEFRTTASGTVAPIEIDNFMIQFKGADYVPMLNAVSGTTGANDVGTLRIRVVAANNDVIRVIAKAAGTTNAVYSATIVATRNEV